MYKPISNNETKSLACSLAEEGKFPPDQLLCCSKHDGNCSDRPECFDPEDNELAKCHVISTLDSCRRDDVPAHDVCDWKGVGNYYFVYPWVLQQEEKTTHAFLKHSSSRRTEVN